MWRQHLFAIVAVAVAACSKPKSGSTAGSGSASPASTDAQPQTFDACKQRAVFQRAAPPPFEAAGAYRLAGQVVINSRDRRYAAHDLAKRTWSKLPSPDLDGADGLGLQAFTKTRKLVAYEKGATTWSVVVLDMIQRAWLRPAPFATPWKTVRGIAVGEHLLVVPYRPCGFDQLAMAHRLDGDRFVPVPGTLAPRARAVSVDVAGRWWLVWGGDVYPDAPAAGNIGCGDDENYRPATDGAVLDVASGTWKPMASGPPPGARALGVVGTSVFMLVDKMLWRYDVASDSWKQLGALDKALGGAHPGDVAAQAVGDRLILLPPATGTMVTVDATSGALTTGRAPVGSTQHMIPLDDTHLLVLPQDRSRIDNSSPPRPIAYLHDVANGSWCELAWSLPHGSSFTVAERVDDRVELWTFEGQGTTVRIEHWAVAQRQGQAVAADMLGLGTAFSAVPFFWSRHYDVSINYVGHAGRGSSIEVIGDLQKRDATVIFRHAGNAPGARRGRITAVATVGRDLQSLAVEAAFERNDDAAVEELVRPPVLKARMRKRKLLLGSPPHLPDNELDL